MGKYEIFIQYFTGKIKFLNNVVSRRFGIVSPALKNAKLPTEEKKPPPFSPELSGGEKTFKDEILLLAHRRIILKYNILGEI